MVVVRAWNPSTSAVEAERSEVQGQPGLPSKSEASLSYIASVNIQKEGKKPEVTRKYIDTYKYSEYI